MAQLRLRKLPALQYLSARQCQSTTPHFLLPYGIPKGNTLITYVAALFTDICIDEHPLHSSSIKKGDANLKWLIMSENGWLARLEVKPFNKRKNYAVSSIKGKEKLDDQPGVPLPDSTPDPLVLGLEGLDISSE